MKAWFNKEYKKAPMDRNKCIVIKVETGDKNLSPLSKKTFDLPTLRSIVFIIFAQKHQNFTLLIYRKKEGVILMK